MKTTEELAREAGMDVFEFGDEFQRGNCVNGFIGELERFRQLVRNEALEEAAKLCESEVKYDEYDEWTAGLNGGFRSAVRQIRALKK